MSARLAEVPIGRYRNSTDTRTVVVDPERAPLVRKVFELLADGTSIGECHAAGHCSGTDDEEGTAHSQTDLQSSDPKLVLLELRLCHLFYILKPAAHALAKLPALAARSWESRKERIAADAKALVRRLEDQRTLNQKAIKARLMGGLSEQDFRSFKASIEAETGRIQEQMTALDSERSAVEESVRQADAEVINIGDIGRPPPLGASVTFKMPSSAVLPAVGLARGDYQ